MKTITAEYFKEATGREPESDDLERCNCPRAGKMNHNQCGWDDEANLPWFQSPNIVKRYKQTTPLQPEPVEPVLTVQMFQDLSDQFDRVMKATKEEKDEADRSAGTAWRMLRKYKYKVRELNKRIQKLEG